MDHTHPEVLFRNIGIIQFTTPADQILASDGVTYNSVRNLQLLDERENKSKKKWIYPNGCLQLQIQRKEKK